MARAPTGFRVDGIEPRHDPVWPFVGAPVHREFWRVVVGFVKDARAYDQARGLDRFGRKLAPIARSTRANRKSAMGTPDPNAPPLTPADEASRTVAYFDGRAFVDHAEFFWRNQWGKVLHYHRAGAGRLPVRDVIGISPKSLKRVEALALAWWAAWKRTHPDRVAKLMPPPRPVVVPVPKRIAAVPPLTPKVAYLGPGVPPSRPSRKVLVYRTPPPPPPPRVRPAPFAAEPGPGPAPRPRPKPTPKPPAPVAAKPVVATPPPPPKPAPKPTAATVPHTRADLPERVEHAAFVRAEHDRAFKELAKELGTTPAALEATMTARFAGAVKEGEFYIRVDSGTLPKVLESGRFKTQFEVGGSLGSYDPTGRTKVEAMLFGTAKDIRPENRPVYGYVSRAGFASYGAVPERSVETYGDASIRLKPGVRARATVTASDSLAFHDRLHGVPAAAPTADALPVSGLRFGRIYERFLKDEADPGKWLDTLGERFGYLEAQYHGGLKVEDIAEVAFTGPPGPRVRAQLEKADIPWRVIKPKATDDD